MYPKNAASPPRISVGAIYLIADGTLQTSGASVAVRPEGGAEGAGGGTIAYGASGTIYYTPTQAETNYTAFTVTVYKASCTIATVTVITTASSTAGQTIPEDGAITAAKLGADAITAAKIADGAFVAENFAASSLNGKGDWNTTVPDAAGVVATALGLLETHGDSTWATATSVTVSDKTGFSLVSTGLDLVTAWTVDITGSLSGSVGSVTAAVTTDAASRTASKATGFATASDVTTAHTTTDGKLDVIDALLDKIAVPIIGTASGAGTGTEVFIYGGVTLTATVDASGNRTAMVFS